MKPSWRPDSGLDTLEKVLSMVKGEADARYYQGSRTVLRFANSRLYQPHHEETVSISLRIAIDGGRIGVATTTDLSHSGLTNLVESATSMAKSAPKLEKFPGFPHETREKTVKIRASKSIIEGELDGKAKEMADALDLAQSELTDARTSGIYNQALSLVSIANTSSLRRSSLRTIAHASFLTEKMDLEPSTSGWSEGSSWDPTKVDLVKLAREAVERTPRETAHSLEPGTYRAILCAPAVAELVSMLSYCMGAFAVEEGWSFLEGKEGKQLASKQVTVDDDPLNPIGLPESVDFEGLPTMKRTIFKKGVVSGPAHDSMTAARMGCKNNRSALPPEAPFGSVGPIPRHLTFHAGDASMDEMVKELKKGVIITRLHYVRFVHRMKTIITGMTRDGTYWVENGEIKGPVTNLRLTDAILRALSGTEIVGKDLRCLARGATAPVVPSLLVRGLTFPTATTF
jgi:predicted Zn-dependent protease